MTDKLRLYHVSLHCASDVNVIFKTFSITLQHISCHDLHQNVFPTWLPVYVVNISNESMHKGTSNLWRCGSVVVVDLGDICIQKFSFGEVYR